MASGIGSTAFFSVFREVITSIYLKNSGLNCHQGLSIFFLIFINTDYYKKKGGEERCIHLLPSGFPLVNVDSLYVPAGSGCNYNLLTLDGVDVMGTRLAEEVHYMPPDSTRMYFEKGLKFFAQSSIQFVSVPTVICGALLPVDFTAK